MPQASISHLNSHPLRSKQLLVLVPDCFEDENNSLVCSEMKYGWIFREGFFSPFPHERELYMLLISTASGKRKYSLLM